MPKCHARRPLYLYNGVEVPVKAADATALSGPLPVRLVEALDKRGRGQVGFDEIRHALRHPLPKRSFERRDKIDCSSRFLRELSLTT